MKNNNCLKLRNKLIAHRYSGSRVSRAALVACVGLASISANHAQAQLMQNLSIGNPKALALGHAVTADPPGIDSIHFNPAGLAKIQGRQQQTKLLAAHMSISSKTGSQQNTQAIRDEFEAFNDNLPDDADPVAFPEDNQANLSATATQPVLILPFAGMTEVPFILAPFGGIAVEDPHQGWTFGTAVYTPMGFGFARDRDEDPGSYQGYETAITRLTYFSPTIGIEVTDTLSVGVGINFSWQGFGTKTKFRAPDQTIIFINRSEAAFAPILGGTDTDGEAQAGILGAFDNIGDLEIVAEDPLSLGFNLGLLWEPTPWLAFGFVYQSETKADMEGEFQMTYSDEFLGTTIGLKDISTLIGPLIGGAEFNAERVEKGKIEVEMIQPQHVAIGTSIQILPSVKFNVDVKWIEYSKWDNLTLSFDQNVDFLNLASIVSFAAGGFVEDNADPDELRIPRGYEDVVSWAFGVEYQFNDALVLRMGYEPRGSAIPDDKVDFLFPIADSNLYSFGFGYQIDAESRMDFAMAYMVSEYEADLQVTETLNEDGKYVETATGESSNANSITPGAVVYNPYAYLPIEGKTEAYLFTISYDEKF
ncbi:hypothetical protein A9Q99_01985 [Gammaproteobacteria bacterium 45_16_T64]|nr:hypothetical protein A9Q99_01985 [Gammaproteobacteria bacterium 45_16_T64]